MAKPYGNVIATCPACNKPIGDKNPNDWCVECGKPLPQEIMALIPKFARQIKTSTVREHPLTNSSTGTKSEPAPDTTQVMMARYKDAYLQARAINGIGGTFKGIGIFLAFLLIIVGLIVTSKGRQGDAVFAVGVVLIGTGVIAGIFLYLIGIVVSAQGQILKATLDSAVNSSPFLTNENRAKIMSLPTP